MKYSCIHIFSQGSDTRGIESFPFLLVKELEKNSKNLCILTRKKPQKQDLVSCKNILNVPYSLLPFFIPFIKSKNIRVVSRIKNPVTFFLFLSAKLFGKKIYSQPDISEEYLKNNFFEKLIIFFNLHLADKIVLATPYEGEVLGKIINKIKYKIIIIPLGSKIKISSTKKRDYILSVAQKWTKRKNLRMALETYSELSKNNLLPPFVIVGDIPSGELNKIQEFVVSKNLKKRIIFVGSKTGKELEDYFERAKIFYLPSKQETFGMVFVEAMSKGVPSIAMNNSAIKYIIENGKTGFLKNTKKEQGKAILNLLKNKKTYKQISVACLKESEKYKWEIVSKQWEKMLYG